MATGDIEPKDALEFAMTPEERMVTLNTIRTELRRGKDNGRYNLRNGRWFLVKNEEGAGSPHEGTPAPFQPQTMEGR